MRISRCAGPSSKIGASTKRSARSPGPSYAQGSEWALLTGLRAQGVGFVHVPAAAVIHTILPHQVEIDWLLGRAERIGRGSARIKRRRVPKSPLGWLGLYARLGLARLRALRAGSLAVPARFRIVHRVRYWQGYVAEARKLRGE